MFDRKDRSIILEKDNRKEKIINNKSKKTSFALSENAYKKLLEISKSLNLVHYRNDIELPNIAKTIEHIILNLEIKNEFLEFINISEKKVTMYITDEMLKNITKFAEINSIFFATGKMNLGLTINYMILKF